MKLENKHFLKGKIKEMESILYDLQQNVIIPQNDTVKSETGQLLQKLESAMMDFARGYRNDRCFANWTVMDTSTPQ